MDNIFSTNKFDCSLILYTDLNKIYSINSRLIKFSIIEYQKKYQVKNNVPSNKFNTRGKLKYIEPYNMYLDSYCYTNK